MDIDWQASQIELLMWFGGIVVGLAILGTWATVLWHRKRDRERVKWERVALDSPGEFDKDERCVLCRTEIAHPDGFHYARLDAMKGRVPYTYEEWRGDIDDPDKDMEEVVMRVKMNGGFPCRPEKKSEQAGKPEDDRDEGPPEYGGQASQPVAPAYQVLYERAVAAHQAMEKRLDHMQNRLHTLIQRVELLRAWNAVPRYLAEPKPWNRPYAPCDGKTCDEYGHETDCSYMRARG